jgi:hypothetical protein
VSVASRDIPQCFQLHVEHHPFVAWELWRSNAVQDRIDLELLARSEKDPEFPPGFPFTGKCGAREYGEFH